MKKIVSRRKKFRINTPMSFGILCAVLLILVGGGVYALAAGVVAPTVQRIEAAKVTPTPDPTSTPELITPIPEDQRTSPAPEEDPDAMLTTTTDPITGAIMPADPNTLAEGTPEPTATPAPLAGRTIVIDAGKSKGGTHRGVSSKTYEYKINLAFAQALQEELTGLGASVVMTRESNDEVVGAKSRIKTINNSGADLAISLFCNDLDNNKTRGAEAFVGKGTGNADRAGDLQAQCLQAIRERRTCPRAIRTTRFAP